MADAWAESKLDLELDNIDLLSSELLSDTFFGDAKNGVLLGSFGATVTDSGLFMFDVILAPGATALIAGTQQWEGGVYAVGGSFVDVSFGLSISNVSCRGACIVPPVPLPAAAYLFASALSGLVLSRRRRQRGGARG